MEHREDDKTGGATPPGAAPRKMYTAPRLRVYGDIATLTRAIGNMSVKADGGSGKNSRTA
jgi:hypothetical protein